MPACAYVLGLKLQPIHSDTCSRSRPCSLREIGLQQQNARSDEHHVAPASPAGRGVGLNKVHPGAGAIVSWHHSDLFTAAQRR